MELAQADRGVLRQLTARFNVATAPDDLVAATRQAIADATDFDERDINRNFAYDYQAYGAVKRNLARLVGSGQLRLAMPLALELMKRGSYQVEMSDEGLMAEDIENCLSVILEALRKSDLPAAEVIAWCAAMLDSDRVGFIARESVQSLRNQVQPHHGTIAEQPVATGKAVSRQAHDLGNFCRMLLRGGELDGKRYLSEKAIRAMSAIQTGDVPVSPQEAYGVGWSVKIGDAAMKTALFDRRHFVRAAGTIVAPPALSDQTILPVPENNAAAPMLG